MARLLIAAAALVVSAAVAGCDGGTDGAAPETATLTVTTNGEAETAVVEADELEAEVERAREDVEATVRELTDSRSRDDVEQALERGADRVAAAADRIEETEAPERAEEARDDLRRALDDLSAELRDRRDEVAAGDLSAVLNSVRSLDTIDEIRDAIDELRNQGLDVDPLGL